MTYAARKSPVQAYAKADEAQKPSPDADPREIEAWGLMRAASELQQALRHPEEKAKARYALQQNQRLWTILQGSVADENNPLDDEVKRNVLQLSLYIDKQTMKALSDLDPERIQELIYINIQIASGLRGKPGDAAAAQAGAEQARQNQPGAGAYGGQQQGNRQRVTISA